MRLIVHIGPHKTGTSALQAFLHRNHRPLRDRGVWYQGLAPGWNHTHLASAFLTRASGARDMLKRCLDEAAGCDTVVISSEVFARRDFDRQTFLSALDGQRATVVAYLRRPDERRISVYDQVVRQNARIEPIDALPLPARPYRATLGEWALVNGNDFVLAPYDPAQWSHDNIFDDFLSMFGVDCGGLDHSVAAGDENRSLPPGLTEVLRLANGIGLTGASREAFIAGLYDLHTARPGWYGGSLLSPECRRELCQRLLDDLDFWRPYLRPGFDPAYLEPSDDAARPGLAP